MSPIVNTEVKMSKQMMQALTLHETFCIASKIHTVTEQQVKEFLTKRFSEKLANQFSTSFLFSTPDA
jgi:protoporphyrinogen oxidase